MTKAKETKEDDFFNSILEAMEDGIKDAIEEDYKSPYHPNLKIYKQAFDVTAKALKEYRKDLIKECQNEQDVDLEEIRNQEFNDGWAEFKGLTMDFIERQFGKDSVIGKELLEGVDNTC